MQHNGDWNLSWLSLSLLYLGKLEHYGNIQVCMNAQDTVATGNLVLFEGKWRQPASSSSSRTPHSTVSTLH